MIIGYQKRPSQCAPKGATLGNVVPNLLKRALFMKDGIHPEYRPVVFKDDSTGYAFLTRSTVSSDRVIEWEDGTEYPLVKLDISSSSHPFYTGQQRLVDTAGRVERFRRRYSQKQEKVEDAVTKTEGAAASDGPADASPEDGGAGTEQ